MNRPTPSRDVVATSADTCRMTLYEPAGGRDTGVGCEAVESTSTRPATSLGYFAAYARTYRPPKECPTSTYGPGTWARVSRVWRSVAICAPSGGLAAGSLQPRPARSYTQTLLSRATAGAINPSDAAEPPPPGSRTTVGPREPVHSRLRRYGPTSTSWPRSAPVGVVACPSPS